MGLDWACPVKTGPDKLNNGILCMVLGEERGDPARRGDVVQVQGAVVQESKQNLVRFETTGPVKSSVERWRC